MNKIGSLESQLMDAFKDKEMADHAAKIAMGHRQKFNDTWRKKNKSKRKTAKASRRKNR